MGRLILSTHYPHGLVESSNVRLGDDCLEEHVFGNLAKARQITETGVKMTKHRPHRSLGGPVSAVFANLYPTTRPASLEPIRTTQFNAARKLGAGGALLRLVR